MNKLWDGGGTAISGVKMPSRNAASGSRRHMSTSMFAVKPVISGDFIICSSHHALLSFTAYIINNTYESFVNNLHIVKNLSTAAYVTVQF